MRMIKFTNGHIVPIPWWDTHLRILELIDTLNIMYRHDGDEEIEHIYWVSEKTWKCKDCNTIYYERMEICENCGKSNIEHIENWIKDGLKRK